MPAFRTTKFVPHSPGDMFDLIADVEKYPEFLPLCEALEVRRRAQSGEGVTTIVADMTVGYKAIRETFTSRVMLDRPRLRILVEYVEGPFKHLENTWLFRTQGDGCEVDFRIDYEFKSRVLGLLMGALFDQAFRRFVAAFDARAAKVYGTRGKPGSAPAVP